MKKFAVLAAVAAVGLGTSMAHAIAVTVGSVAAYDAGVGTPGNVAGVVDAGGAFTGQVTRSTFTTDVASAFAANRGGVVNFDTGFVNGTNYGDGPSNAITATFGTGSVGIYRSDISGLSTATPVAYFAIQPNNNNIASGTTSGGTSTTANGGYLGLQGNFGIDASPTQEASAGGGVNFMFTTGLAEVGLSLVPRAAARSVTLTAILDNGTLLSSGAQASNGDNTATPAGGTASTGVTGIFYGFAAPAGRTITGLRLNEAARGFARFDDLGVILPAATPGTPEPAALGVLALGGMAALCRKRA